MIRWSRHSRLSVPTTRSAMAFACGARTGRACGPGGRLGAEVDAGARAGLTTGERERLRQLERENRELRRANEILKAVSVFFARKLDPRLPK